MIKIFSCGLLDTNTYVAWEEETREGLIVDCGVEPLVLQPYLLENNIKVKYVVLTHGHFDHAEYVEKYGQFFKDAQIICHENELTVLYDIEANLSRWGGNERAYECDYTTVKEGDVLSLGKKDSDTCMNFTVLHTPGHTPGCLCLYDEKSKIMFTGDTLFKRGYGRTDFKYGDSSLLISSLVRLLKMDKEIVFYPGHDQSSTIGKEAAGYLMD